MFSTCRSVFVASSMMLFFISDIQADVRTCQSKCKRGTNDRVYPACTLVTHLLGFDEPNTFGYKGLERQRRQNYDTFVRSNIDNQANRRNEKREAPQDMLPCRQPFKHMQIVELTRGKKAQLPIQWNNGHDSSCEINFWTGDMQSTCPIRKPYNCGGGFKNQLHDFTIPMDLQGCSSVDDNCFLQMYGHSVETRTYAFCIRFTLSKSVPAHPAAPRSTASPAPKRIVYSANMNRVDLENIPHVDPTKYAFDYTANNVMLDSYVGPTGSTSSEPSCILRPSINYHDSFDTSHIDQDYSSYRGQQPSDLLAHVKGAICLRSYVGDGGLVRIQDDSIVGAEKSLYKVRKAWKGPVKRAIKQAEGYVRQRNKLAMKAARRSGKCYECDQYDVVGKKRFEREYKNTYVSNVNYQFICDTMAPLMEKQGLRQYAPTRKQCPNGTPEDPIGMYLKDDRPSHKPAHPSQSEQGFQPLGYCSDPRGNSQYIPKNIYPNYVPPGKCADGTSQ